MIKTKRKFKSNNHKQGEKQNFILKWLPLGAFILSCIGIYFTYNLFNNELDKGKRVIKYSFQFNLYDSCVIFQAPEINYIGERDSRLSIWENGEIIQKKGLSKNQDSLFVANEDNSFYNNLRIDTITGFVFSHEKKYYPYLFYIWMTGKLLITNTGEKDVSLMDLNSFIDWDIHDYYAARIGDLISNPLLKDVSYKEFSKDSVVQLKMPIKIEAKNTIVTNFYFFYPITQKEYQLLVSNFLTDEQKKIDPIHVRVFSKPSEIIRYLELYKLNLNISPFGKSMGLTFYIDYSDDKRDTCSFTIDKVYLK